MSIKFLSTRTIKLPTGEQTVRLPTTTHCYLLTYCLKDGPVAAVIMANVVANVANLMNGAIVPHMGKLAIGAKASIISKLFVVPSIKPDTPINVYTRFCLNTAKSKFSLVSPVADW